MDHIEKTEAYILQQKKQDRIVVLAVLLLSPLINLSIWRTQIQTDLLHFLPRFAGSTLFALAFLVGVQHLHYYLVRRRARKNVETILEAIPHDELIQGTNDPDRKQQPGGRLNRRLH